MDVYIAGSLRHTPKEWWGIYEKIGKLVESLGFKTHVHHINIVKDVTGVEIGLALKLNKPIICLARNDADVTSMVLGPVHIGKIDLIGYKNEEDALNQLKTLFSKNFNNLVD